MTTTPTTPAVTSDGRPAPRRRWLTRWLTPWRSGWRLRLVLLVVVLAVLSGAWSGARALAAPRLPDKADVGVDMTVSVSAGVPTTFMVDVRVDRVRLGAHLVGATVPDLPPGVHVALIGAGDDLQALPNIDGFPGDPRWHLGRLLFPLAGRELHSGQVIRVAEVVTADRPGAVRIRAPRYRWAAGPWRGQVTQGIDIRETVTRSTADYTGSVLGAPPTAGG